MLSSLLLASDSQRPFPTPGLRQWFLILALLAGASILIPTTLLLVGYLLLKIGSYSPVFTVFYAPYFFLMVIYADPVRYLALNLAVIILVFTVLRWARPGRWATLWLVASLVTILLHPFTLGSYQPALRAQPERRMIVPTQPALFVASAAQPEVILAYIQAPGVRPADLEPVTRSIYLVEREAMQSSDGRWLALVSQHLYGPQDVLLIQIADLLSEDS